MADAKLDELVRRLELEIHAMIAGRGPPAATIDRYNAAKARIVAHVREREVELMGLALHAEYGYGLGRSHKRVVKDWRYEAEGHRKYLRETARALRDAYDRQGEGETCGSQNLPNDARTSSSDATP